MVLDLNRTLPVRIRPLHLESPESYGRRLARANGLPTRSSAKAARQIAAASGAQALREALELWCESKGGLSVGHFQRQTRRVGEGLPGRTLCRLCAHGGSVGQINHHAMNCCLRHGLWTGPGTIPTDQVPVGEDVMAAERRYRYLLRRKRVDLSLMRALTGIVTLENGADRARHVYEVECYPAAIALAALLTDRRVHRRLFDARLTFAEAHARLREHLGQAVPGAEDRLADGVWLLLRPSFLWVRKHALGAPVGEDFVPLIGVNPIDIRGANEVVRPLEPFNRFLALLHKQRGNSPDERREVYVISSQGEAPDAATTGPPSLLICKDGHVVRRGWDKAVAALDKGRSMCPICNGGQPLPGYNTIAETHPRLALEWNDGTNGLDVSSSPVAGSNEKCVWTCRHGHSFTATVANRALNGSGCPVCSNLAVRAGVNDLASTHPDLAAEWHPQLNGELSPEHVIGGRNAKVAWLCLNGHAYWKTVAKRKGGQECGVCSGRHLEPGVNDLATTHPALTAEWHLQLNGKLRPTAVSAGSDIIVHWVCPSRHVYKAPIGNRTGSKKAGCPYCSNRRLLIGFNDLATQYPALARDWDPVRNSGLTATEVLPGSRLRWWVCANGHEQEMMFRNRLRAGGCTECPRDERAATRQ